MIEKDFSWEEADSVIIEPVDAVAVYSNQKGEIVVRQQNRFGEEDSFILIPRSLAGELIGALSKEMGREEGLKRVK